MTTKDMDAILEVAQTHNFNRAAENLFMAQSTLSYHIRAAEDELGFAIFVRSGKGAALTPALKKVQQRIIAGGRVNYFNSAGHETTLTNVAAEKGVCLSPGFLNDRNPEFAWAPFDCKETISCVLRTHREDHRPIVREFVALLREHYRAK